MCTNLLEEIMPLLFCTVVFLAFLRLWQGMIDNTFGNTSWSKLSRCLCVYVYFENNFICGFSGTIKRSIVILKMFFLIFTLIIQLFYPILYEGSWGVHASFVKHMKNVWLGASGDAESVAERMLRLNALDETRAGSSQSVLLGTKKGSLKSTALCWFRFMRFRNNLRESSHDRLTLH